MKKEELLALVDFNAWANARMMTAAEGLTSEQFTREVVSSFSSVRDTFGHILAAEWAWLERSKGQSPAAMPSVKEFSDLALLRARWTELAGELQEHLRGLTQPEVERVVEYKTFSYGPGSTPRWQMIQHMVNHGTYHRGQVTTMLRQLGVTSVGTDLIAFYREKSSAAAGNP